MNSGFKISSCKFVSFVVTPQIHPGHGKCSVASWNFSCSLFI